MKNHPALCKYCTEISRKYFADCSDVLKLPALLDPTVSLDSLKEELKIQKRENFLTYIYFAVGITALSIPQLLKITYIVVNKE